MLQQGITYNTTMALVTGAIMVLLVVFARAATRPDRRTLTGWAWAFIGMGSFLAVTGLHMTLTWPLKEVDGAFCCSVDNITFGEPAAFYGILTVVAGIAVLSMQNAADKGYREFDLVATVRPILYVGAIGGFGLVLFGIAGMHFGMWRPPDIEPIARLMHGTLVEPVIQMLLYILTGVTAVLAPFALEHKRLARVALTICWISGLGWCLLAFTVFYSHVGFFPQP
jgi:uncharacterized membrane protein